MLRPVHCEYLLDLAILPVLVHANLFQDLDSVLAEIAGTPALAG